MQTTWKMLFKIYLLIFQQFGRVCACPHNTHKWEEDGGQKMVDNVSEGVESTFKSLVSHRKEW